MIKTTILHTAKALGLFGLSRRLTARGLRILCYHGIWLGEGHFGNNLYMSASKFEGRMAQLAASAYPVLPLGEAVERLEAGTLPDCGTVITIDDAWYGTYCHMMPSLSRHSLPSTLYVTSHYADQQRPVFDVTLRYLLERAPKREFDLGALPSAPATDGLTTYSLDDDEQRGALRQLLVSHGETALDEDGKMALCRAVAEQLEMDYDALVERRIFHLMSAEELREAAEQGVDLQLHTHNHRIAETGADSIEQTLRRNREWLAPVVDTPLRHFCYPSGVWEEANWPELEKAGVKSATTTEAGINFAGAPPLALSRIVDGEETPWIEIEAELSGLLELGRRLRRKLGLLPAAGAHH